MAESVDFAVAVERADDRAVVTVEGDLDMSSAPTFEEALSSVEEGSDVLLDLSACTFVDSAGMRAIVHVVKTSSRVAVVTADPALLRVFEITSLDTMVSIHPSREEAC